MKLFSYLFSFFIIFNSCKTIHDGSEKKGVENTLTTWYQKQISLPDSLLIFNSGQMGKIKLNEYLSRDIKILSFLSNGCSKCTISQLMFWDDFCQNYKNISNLQLILVYSGPNEYLINVLMEGIEIQLPILIDESSYIVNNNHLFKDELYQTVLLDKKDKVLLIGDFRQNEDLEELYKEEIEKQIECLY